MKRLEYIRVAVLLAAVALLGNLAVAQEVKSSGLSRDTITIGDQVVWRALFTVPERAKVGIAPYASILNSTTAGDTTGGVAPYNLGEKIDLLRDFTLDTLSVKEGMREIEANILLTSYDSGSYKLPQPLVVVQHAPELGGSDEVVTRMDTLRFDMPSLNVLSVPVDTANFQIREIKGQMRYPLTFGEVFPWVLLGLFVIVVIYLITRYIIYRRQNKDFFGRSLHKDPPHIVALRRLEKLRGEKLWQNGKEKQFYTGVTETLRTYIEARYSVSAMEKTSSEIMEELKDKEIEEKIYGRLEDLFKLSDLVKFAKYSPGIEENEEVIPTAVSFVNSTFMQTLEAEKEEK